MTKAIQEKVILNEIKEISLNRIGGNIPKYFDEFEYITSIENGRLLFLNCHMSSHPYLGFFL